MFGRKQQRVVAGTGASQRLINRFAPSVGNVRVVCPEDHQEFAADFFCAGQRSGICILTEFAVMDAGAVVADRGADIGLEPGTECEVAPYAETHDPYFPSRDLGMFGKPVQTSAAIRIEMRDGSLRGILLASGASRVIEWDHRSRRLDSPINFRGSGNKSIPSEPYACAQQGRC